MARSLVNPHPRINRKSLPALLRLHGGKMPTLTWLSEETRFMLAADADGAEAQDYVAAGDGAAEALHGTEAREQEHLIELMAQIHAVRAGNDLVADHLAVLVYGDINEQAVGKSKLNIVLLRRPGRWILGKADEFRGAQDIQRHVIGNGAHGDPGSDKLQDQNENENGGEKSAGSRNGERPKNIVEQEFRAIANFAHAAVKILRGNGLRGGYANTHGQIRGRQIPGHAR